MVRIAVSKGRDARLNKAIFLILAQEEPLTIYDIWRKLRTQRDFVYIRYHIANRRVRALEERGYVEKIGERKTKTGFAAKLYHLTSRAYLAMLLDRVDPNTFIERAPEAKIISALATFVCVEYFRSYAYICSFLRSEVK